MKYLSKSVLLMVFLIIITCSTVTAETEEVIINSQEEVIQEIIDYTEQLNVLLEKGKNEKKPFLKVKGVDKKTIDVANEMLFKPDSLQEGVTRSIYPTYNRGETGNYLVTTDGISSLPVPGHAGLIYTQNLCIESFAEGVGWYINDWDTRGYGNVFEYKVNYSGSAATNAALYAQIQVGDPYNYNFFNVWTESKFYCSQLVWRAWYNQGYDIDGLSNGVVAPVDLTHANNATIIYSSLWK